MGVSRLTVATRKEVRGEVLYNDGDFAEVQTIGMEGIERGLTEEMHGSN